MNRAIKNTTRVTIGRRMRGLSLVELMIAITLGMLIVAAVLALFLNITRTNNEMSRMNRQIENGRFAIQLLQSDLAHAGFWADFVPQFDDRGVLVPGDTPTAIPDPCLDPASWVAADRNNLIGLPVQHVAGSCTVTNPKAGASVLVVRHAEPNPGMAACPAGDVCFQVSSCALEVDATPSQSYVLALESEGHGLHKKNCVGTGSPQALPITAGDLANVRRFGSNIYYVRNDNTLMRSEYANGAHQAPQPLVDGIEDFRVLYGIDNVGANGAPVSYAGSVNRGDGVPDEYRDCSVAACTALDLANVVAVRISVLARSTEPSPGHTDTKVYTLGNADVGPFNDAFKRHVFTTTVRLTNPAGRREAP